jgi:F420H(2)-dependent quinone reductase
MAGNVKARSFSALSRIMSQKSMRPVVRVLMNAHVFLYRLTGGKAQFPQFPTLLLTITGRKTGKLRTIPLIYVTDGSCFVIAAAYAGSDRHPTWWLNLQHNPRAEVQVMRRKVNVRAEPAAVKDRADLWQRLAAMYPYFMEYQERTQREIPVIILRPIDRES